MDVKRLPQAGSVPRKASKAIPNWAGRERRPDANAPRQLMGDSACVRLERWWWQWTCLWCRTVNGLWIPDGKSYAERERICEWFDRLNECMRSLYV